MFLFFTSKFLSLLPCSLISSCLTVMFAAVSPCLKCSVCTYFLCADSSFLVLNIHLDLVTQRLIGNMVELEHFLWSRYVNWAWDEFCFCLWSVLPRLLMCFVFKVSPESASQFGELVADPVTNELLHYTEKPETFVCSHITDITQNSSAYTSFDSNVFF